MIKQEVVEHWEKACADLASACAGFVSSAPGVLGLTEQEIIEAFKALGDRLFDPDPPVPANFSRSRGTRDGRAI